MIKDRKSTLERRISKLESRLKNESVDFEQLSNSLRDSQDEISDAATNLYRKYRKFVSARPSVGRLEYEIPEEAFAALDEATAALRNAIELVKDARRTLDYIEY